MRKVLSIVLALCMMLALSVPSMAEGTCKIGMVTDVGGVNDTPSTRPPGKAWSPWPLRILPLK